jgi:carbonic anhydrase
MRSALLAVLLSGIAGSAAAQTAHWDYQGPHGALNWGKLDPAYTACSKGHEQSPIDIRGARLNKGLAPIEFHYIAGAVTEINDGRTIQVWVDPGSYILANGVRYDLVQFSFHHPGEHAVRGKLSDMDVQLTHKSAEGKIAIVDVRLNEDVGNPNATLAALWSHMPTTSGAQQKITEMVNPAGLLPADRSYWTYQGSLSHPPCTEGVHWYVFEQELGISRDQLRTFSGYFRISSRPVQDTHGRRIEAQE